MSLRSFRLVAICVALTVPAACSERSPLEPIGPGAPAASLLPTSLLQCPEAEAWSISGTVTPAGGNLAQDGFAITVPAGAVAAETQITLTVPASSYVEIEVTANGADHFQFETPVTVTMSYARCPLSVLSGGALGVWYIDTTSKGLLSYKGGTTNPISRTITFQTDHFSGYAIAD